MMLDALFSDMKRRGIILVSPTEVYEDEQVTPRIRAQVRRHSAHIEMLIRLADIRVCPSRDLHRQYWRRSGPGYYTCDVCERIAV